MREDFADVAHKFGACRAVLAGNPRQHGEAECGK
jgi:hypothetical protein